MIPGSTGIYLGAALLLLFGGLMVAIWWQGRKAGLAVTQKTEADHAKEANQVRDTVHALSDTDLDRELRGKR